LPDSDDILGYIYIITEPDSFRPELISWLSSFHKPVSIYDDSGGWEYPRALSRNKDMKVFTTSTTEDAGMHIARYLLGNGHYSIAYFSPFHKAAWSVRRLDGIKSTYRAAGYGGNVRCFTLDSFRRHNDFRSGVGRRVNIAAYDRFIKSWLDSLPQLYAGRLQPLLRTKAFIQTNYGEAAIRTAQLFARALAKKEITAWICANDNVAIMARDYLLKKRIPVPEKISIIGFDDSDNAYSKRITSYNFNLGLAARYIVGYVLNRRIISKSLRHKKTVIKGMIVERETVGKKRSERREASGERLEAKEGER
jgi:hypothetical protein